MNTNAPAYRRVASRFADTLYMVREDQWQNASPCNEWSAFDVAAHVIATHRRIYSMLNPDGIGGFDEDAPLPEQWSVAAAAIAEALDDPLLSHVPVRTRSGDRPFYALVEGLLLTDTLCHTWDLARAINANDELDPEAVAIAYAMLAELGDGIRVAGGFKEPIDPAVGADAQTVFLNFAGRRV